MKSVINWFEIPVRDMSRAAACYEALLGKPLKRETFGGVPYSIFSYEKPGVSGALVEDAKRSPGGGTLVYLNVNGELDAVLARADAAKAKVVLPRTPIGPGGFIAIVVDTEGNQIGLSSES